MFKFEFLTDKQNLILNELHEMTDGKIILSGSSVLKLNGIIERSVGNININLNVEDITYYNQINNVYELDYVRNQDFGIKNKTYWFRRHNTVGVMFISEHMDYEICEIDGKKLRVGTVKSVRDNKEELSISGDANWIKHYNDVQTIDKFYDVEKPIKSLL